MQHFFYAVHSFVNRRKFLSVAAFSGVFALFLFFAAQIKFSEDITNLIPSSNQSDITAKVLKQMNFADKISIVISVEKKGTAEDITSYATEFLDSLEGNSKPYISKIQGRIDEQNIEQTYDFVYANLPLFLDAKDYEALNSKFRKDSIQSVLEKDYKSLVSPAGMVSKNFILRDPLGISFIALRKLQQLSIGDNFGLQNGFVVTKDSKNLLLFITPKLPPNETDRNTIFIKHLESAKRSLNSKYAGKARLQYFGATPVAVANATQIKADVRNTSLFAAVTLILILAFFYRSLFTPIIIFIPSLFGAVFALAVLYFVKGSISAISLGISSILLGETTDYSIYVLTHLRNNKDVKLLYKDITKPLMLCGMTTGITFLCLYFVKSEALKDLGIFAAISVIATSIFSLLLIPLLYKASNKKAVQKKNAIDWLGNFKYDKSKILVISVLVAIIACVFTFSKVTFNNDISALNFVPTELKQSEKYLEKIAEGDTKSLYLAVYANDSESALESNSKLFEILKDKKHQGEISNFSSIGGIVLSKPEQQQKIAQWNAFWNGSKKVDIQNQIVVGGKAFGFRDNSFSEFYEMLAKDFKPVAIEDYAKVNSLFIDEFATQKNGLYTISTLVKLPSDKRDAFVNAIKKQPNLTIIDRQQTNETFLGSLKENFEKLIDYSFIAIFLMLFLAFRRIELALITMVPIALSWILTTGIMGLFGLQFNIINIIVCTLIFGIGVDYSIFMTAALQKEHTFGTTELPTYKVSILLSVATTILGIGVLIFAHHPALKSIALIAIIGILSALVITFVLQPRVFRFFITGRTANGQPPFQLRSFLHGILSFLYYGLGGIFMSLISIIILPILPFSKEKKMRGFRSVMSKFMKSVLYTNPFVDKKVLNPNHEKFDKPAVIIANHTSFLDILAIGMLSPKTIYLVSDWVYNSPIFGAAVKASGFYPVSEGIEGGVEHLRKKIEEGYSLIVFPEGTRSKTNQIQRFHKGAFYLAEYFNLDILPVIIHGNSEVLPKGDFIIYDGSITVSIGGRITPENKAFGENYAVRTKKISVFFKNEFDKIRHTIEVPNYFRKTLLNSFDYKEPKVIDAVKKGGAKNLELYHSLWSRIGQTRQILHIADDYGQLDVLLFLQEPHRKITSLIADAEKRSVAKGNYIARKGNIRYIDSIADADSKYDILLTSAQNKIADIAAFSDRIILVDVVLDNELTNAGFEIEYKNDRITALKREQS